MDCTETYLLVNRRDRSYLRIDRNPEYKSFLRIAESGSFIVGPRKPQNLSISNVTKSEADLDWDDLAYPFDDYSVKIYNNTTGILEQEVTGIAVSNYHVTNLVTDDNYDIWVVSVKNGIESNDSNHVTANPIDIVAPAAPTGLAVDQATNNSIDLSWNPNSEGDLAGYNVYVDAGTGYSKANTNGLVSAINYNIPNLINGDSYDMKITAVDGSGNESGFSSIVSATVTDTQAPSAPTNLAIDSFTDTTVTLSWTDSPESDVAGYNVYVDSIKQYSLVSSPQQVASLIENTNYSFYVTAEDGNGNESAASNIVSQTTQNVAPAALTGVNANPGNQSATISWDASPEHDLAGYNVYEDGVKSNSSLIPKGTLNYEDLNLTNGQSYDFYVTAVDTEGAESAASAIVSVTLSSYMAGYMYKKQIDITGATGAGTNFQVPLLIGFQANTNGGTGFDFHLNGNSQNFPTGKNDSGDINFGNLAEETAYSFWVERVTGTGTDAIAKVWVKVDASLENNNSIYCYYGNGSASNVSNGDATFIFFDDFEGASLDTNKWGDNPNVSVSNSLLTVTGEIIESINTFDVPIELLTYQEYGGCTQFGIAIVKNGDAQDYLFSYNNNGWYIRVRSAAHGQHQSSTVLGQSLSIGERYWLRLQPKLDTDSEINGLVYRSDFNLNSSRNLSKFSIDATPGVIRISNGYNPAGGYAKTDWIFAKKWNATMPSFLSAGAQQVR